MIWGRCDLGEARGPPAVRIHCCWTEPLRGLDALIGVGIARAVGAGGAVERGGGRWAVWAAGSPGGGPAPSSARACERRSLRPRLASRP